MRLEECFQWKVNRQCAKGDSCRFTHDSLSGNRYKSQKGQGRSSSLVPDVKAKTDGQKPFKRSGSRGQSPWEARSRFRCPNKSCEDPSCNCWHPPVCQNYKSETGCNYGRKCRFRHVEAEKPSTKAKKGGAKGSVASLKEYIQLGCVSQDSQPRRSVLRQLDHAVKFSKGTWHHVIIRERKGPSGGTIQRREPHERTPCATKFEERSREITLQQEGCARKAARTWRKIFAS